MAGRSGLLSRPRKSIVGSIPALGAMRGLAARRDSDGTKAIVGIAEYRTRRRTNVAARCRGYCLRRTLQDDQFSDCELYLA